MKTIQHILARYTAFLWAILQPLGAWGVFAVAALDGAAVGLPMDVVVGGYVALTDAGARTDPIVAGVDEFFDVGIGQYFLWKIAAGARNS